MVDHWCNCFVSYGAHIQLVLETLAGIQLEKFLIDLSPEWGLFILSGEIKMKKYLLFSVGLILTTALIPNIFFMPAKGDPQEVSAIPRELTSYSQVVKKVLPAVVSIESKSKAATKERGILPRRFFPIPEIPEDFRKFFGQFPDQFDFGDEFSPMLGFASGFVIDPSGIILTNNHVVKGADKVIVEFQDGRKFTAKEIRNDPKTDLAILIIDGKNLPSLKMGNSNKIEIGDRVLAIGAPFGLIGSVTAGIISGKGRNLQMNMYEEFIQTDAAINPGNSGGPLVDLEGNVIGVNTAIKTRTGGWQGVGLAIASDLVEKVWPQLHKEGKVKRGFLGIQVAKLDPEVASRLGVPKDQGVLISKVFENTPAFKSGLKEGDVLVSIHGKKIKDGQQVQQIVTGLLAGKVVEMGIVRDGKSISISVTIEEQPQEFGLVTQHPLQNQEADGTTLENLGIKVADLNSERAGQFGYKKASDGAVITYVEPGSLAFEAGVERGHLITKVNNQEVKNAEVARKALQSGSLEKGILLQMLSPHNGTSFALLKVVSGK